MNLEQNIQNHLFELFAKDFDNARDVEFFTSLAYSIKQIIGRKWYESLKINNKNNKVYILSFEYSFADNLLTNLVKLNLIDEVKEICNKYNIDFEKVKRKDINFALGFSDLADISSGLLKLLAANRENVYAYGLRYRSGMLKQEIVNGEQVEKQDNWNVNKNPWEHEKSFHHRIDFKDYSVKAIPYDLPIMSNDGEYVNTLRLWKSHSINNINFELFAKSDILNSYNDINRANSIVEFLYPNEDNYEGKKLRLTQEYFFVRASIQDILSKHKKYIYDDLSNISDYCKIQINGVNPIFSILVFIDILVNKYEIEFSKALKLAKKTFIFLHLSLLPESFKKWELNIVSEVCENLIDIINKIDIIIKNELISNGINDTRDLQIIRKGSVDLINLAYYMCKDIITFNVDYYDLIRYKYLPKHYEYYNKKIIYLDLNYDNRQYLKEINIESERIYSDFDKIDIKKYKKIKRKNKLKLLNYINYDKNLINIDSPFVMHLGVFHEYKRQILSALGIALQYYRLKINPNLDIPERTYIFAGKSYPNYIVAKESIKLINALANQINNDLFIKDKIKIIFVPNYDANKTNMILPACDIIQKLDLLTMQASDVLFNKAILAGASVITTKSSYNDIELSEKNIKTYEFGLVRDDFIINENNEYDMYSVIRENPQLNEMFNYFRTLPRETFPYDINNIYNAIYYFNDRHMIFKDLFEYVDVLEKAIKDYTNEDLWIKTAISNSEKVLGRSDVNDVPYYLQKVGRIDG